MDVVHTRKYITKNGHSLLLRPADPLDVKKVLKLSSDVISENGTLVTTSMEFVLTEEQQREMIFHYLNDPGSAIIVVELNNQIIGLLTFQRGILQRFSHHGSVGMIVKKEWRGQGIGKALLATLVEWAYSNPLIEKLCLEVFASNTGAIALYESLGFIEEGRQKYQVKLDYGVYDDLVIMGKFLS